MATEMVKIEKLVVDKVRDNKTKTGVNIGKFFELAAEEKLKKDKIKKKY